MFQIYLKSAAGGIIAWQSECRLVHLSTGKYLSLSRDSNDSSKFKLVRDPLDPDTVFILHPVDKVNES